MAESTPAANALPKPKRGRPPGAKNKVFQTERLGVHHFAFLRAWIQGVDSSEAWQRYMSFSDPVSDARHVEARRRDLMESVLRIGHLVNQKLDDAHQIGEPLRILAETSIAPKVVPIPPLEEWAASMGYDLDNHFMEDLLDEYKAHFHIDRPLEDGEQESKEEIAVQRKVRALNHVETALVTQVTADDLLSLWLHPSSARSLNSLGVATVGQLIAFINRNGYHWNKGIRGIGRGRAHAIVGWLKEVSQQFGVSLSTRATTPPGRPESSSTALVVPSMSYGIVPLPQLLVEPSLSGRAGLFRTGMPNSLDAHDDLEAVRAWLAKYREKKHTYRSYEKEVERFVLWCVHERRKPLSSVSNMDCLAYRDFLQALPSSWIQRPGARREHDDGWRPFRGQLSPSSIKQAVVIIQTMFKGLQDAGYVVANPMSMVSGGFDLPKSKMDLRRALTDQQWAYVRGLAQAGIETPVGHRLVAVLELLVATGIRLEELAGARWSDFSQVQVEGHSYWMLEVTGKRKKVRRVQVPDEVVDLLRKHRHHYQEGRDELEDGQAPLAGLIGVPVGMKPEALPSLSPALSSSAIYKVLRRFFRQAAAAAPEGIDAEHLGRASTHWLRHTFGTQSAASDVPLDVLQHAMGHASLSTTSVYVNTADERMAKEMAKAQERRRLAGVSGTEIATSSPGP